MIVEYVLKVESKMALNITSRFAGSITEVTLRHWSKMGPKMGAD